MVCFDSQPLQKDSTGDPELQQKERISKLSIEDFSKSFCCVKASPQQYLKRQHFTNRCDIVNALCVGKVHLHNLLMLNSAPVTF